MLAHPRFFNSIKSTFSKERSVMSPRRGVSMLSERYGGGRPRASFFGAGYSGASKKFKTVSVDNMSWYVLASCPAFDVVIDTGPGRTDTW